jgi:hypothetical protein
MSKKLEAAIAAAKKAEARAAAMLAHETLLVTLRDALQLARMRDYRTVGERLAGVGDIIKELDAGATPEKVSDQ